MKNKFITDLLAGLTVSFAAISLGAAFGEMSGRGAFAGMMGAAIIPIITSLFGGTRIQASGPTAPMTAITALFVAYAYENYAGNKIQAEQFITLVILLSGLLIILTGIIRLGKFIEKVPNVVILGFMNGIAVLIWYDQLKKLIGFGGTGALGGGILTNSAIAIITLSMIFLLPWTLKKLQVPKKIKDYMPAILFTIVLVTIVTTALNIEADKVKLGSTINSIAEFKNMVLDFFPTHDMFNYETIKTAMPFALQLTLLAYLDSLLTALVVDKMTKEKSKLNKELIAQGLANSASGLFQGIPGAQATIRSVLLIKEGAQTRLAGVFIGVFALLGILVFKNYISLITSAVFVGVLFKVGYDVLDHDFPVYYLKNKWYKNKQRNIQLLFILYTTALTVIIDLNFAVISGTILFYLFKKLISIEDVEAEFEEISEEEQETITA